MTLTLVECDRYRFDANAAEKPIRFIEKFCRHYEGRRFAGKPFRLLEWQKQLIRNLFGWIDRITGKRRFSELYLITAKGAGKTPMLAAIGLYMLLEDGEPAAHVVSMASSFEQANLTFGAAKAYIEQSPELSERAQVLQHEIKAIGYAKWTTISGKPTGRSGPRPSCVIADEGHEWPTYTAQAFEMLCKNLFKREQPLLMVATNAGEDRTSFARQLHERALDVLSGKLDDPSLLPVIYEADKSLDWRSEEAAKAANPSLGEIVTFDQIKREQSKGEKAYRRLFLSQWISGSDKWLDLDAWDLCSASIDRDKLAEAKAPLWIGLDESAGDDLYAVTFVWPHEDKFYVDAHFWMTTRAADAYHAKDPALKYREWAEEGHLTLIEGKTITPADKLRIAEQIIAMRSTHNVKAVCFDRKGSDDCIARLESSGLTCVGVAQGYTLTPGCREIERRLTEQSIIISPNKVLRLCAENVEVKFDDRGNFWPVKPHQKNRYAGMRSAKIDGITALVTASNEARKHSFAAAKRPVIGAWLVKTAGT